MGSLLQFLVSILKRRMNAQDVYAKAMERALARKPFLRSDGRYLSREEAQGRSRLR